MNTRRVKLAQGIIAERAGASLLLYTSSSKETRRVDGLDGDVIDALASGKSASAPTSPALLSLVGEGILVEDHGVSRRSVVKAAAMGSAASVAVLSMPHAAAASSAPTGGTLYGLLTFSGQTWGDYTGLIDLGDHTVTPNSTDVLFFLEVYSPPNPPYSSLSALTGTINWNSQTYPTYLVEFGGSALVWMHLLPPGTTDSPIDDDLWDMSFTYEGADWTVLPDLR